MEDLAREVIAGIAVGGFTAAVVKANLLALKMLGRFNRLAMETALDMYQGLRSLRLWRQQMAADESET